MEKVRQQYRAAFPIAELREHPDNPNRGDDDVVAESVDALGFYGAVLVQQSTGYLLAGHTRTRVALAEGATTIPALIMDVDDDTAKRILLVDNEATRRGEADSRAVLDLLSNLAETERGLVGTGYDADGLDMLRRLLTPVEPIAPAGFPSVSPDTLETDYRCPSCGYEWSGSPTPGVPLHEG